ncbi:MAG: SDR family oxidoreductase [Proteobacteria bacterium]|nr:SDR family oxidoreductase [Pseudomonadota bacterium]
MKKLFMTGATGFVGGEVIKRYLDRSDIHIVAMIRAVDEARLEKRLGKLLKAHWGDKADTVRDRFTFVRGDLLKEGFGLSDEDREMIVTTCDSVLHCAASVDFGATLEFSREYNVDGTRRMLEICEAMGDGLERLDYISTAYVSGNRSDVCKEDELSNRGIGWANFYEQSKFEAEALVRSFREQGHPVSIYRPSTVVGDSNTGETPNFNVLYWPLRVFARGWWNLMIGYETTPVDVVPVNYVADCIVNLSLKGDSTIGRNYHLAAGPDKICHIKDLATHASKWFNQPYPTFVTPEDFDKNIRPQMDAEATPALRMLISQGKVYMPYFVRSPLFDVSNVVADLEGTDTEPCMPIAEYFDTLFAYCVETDWGRKRPKPPGGEGAADTLDTPAPA